jgi:hypothetical protein
VPEFREREGRWLLRAARAELLAPALELARARRAALRETSAPAELAGTRAWYKHDHLRGKTRWRYALKRLLLQPLPRFAEYRNLEWLRARAFLAPRPLVAGCLFQGLLPCYQFLVSERVEPAETLAAFLDRRDDPLREAVLEELAREVARLHALHFVHRDLYARNLLVQREGQAGRVFLLDCWAGGPLPGLRGTAYDLRCFLEDAGARLGAAERERFLALYAEERAAQT